MQWLDVLASLIGGPAAPATGGALIGLVARELGRVVLGALGLEVVRKPSASSSSNPTRKRSSAPAPTSG